jgi:hypothetical protein
MPARTNPARSRARNQASRSGSPWKPQFQLDHAAVAALDGHGWSAPTVVEPGGFTAPNYAIDQPGADAPELAALAVRTLIEVFGVTEVAALSIKAV